DADASGPGRRTEGAHALHHLASRRLQVHADPPHGRRLAPHRLTLPRFVWHDAATRRKRNSVPETTTTRADTPSRGLPTKRAATRGVALTLDAVTHRFGQTVAVDTVSLAVEPGEIVALLGPSG